MPGLAGQSPIVQATGLMAQRAEAQVVRQEARNWAKQEMDAKQEKEQLGRQLDVQNQLLDAYGPDSPQGRKVLRSMATMVGVELPEGQEPDFSQYISALSKLKKKKSTDPASPELVKSIMADMYTRFPRRAKQIGEIEERQAEEQEASNVQQALDIRQLAGGGELTPEQQAGAGLPSAERGLLARGGATGQALLKEGAGVGSEPFAKVDPSKYTPESVRKFQQTGQQGDLVAATGIGAKYTDEADMLKTFLNLSKPFRAIRDSYARIQAAAEDPSAAGDLALIFNFMKMLDPGSVVRESEFATAANSAGVPDRIRKTYNRLIDGERLAPNTRKDFVTRSDKLFKRQDAQHTQREQTFRTLAKNRGFNPENVAINLRDPLVAGAEATAAGAPQAEGGRTVTRKGTEDGRKVIQYSDGSVEYAD